MRTAVELQCILELIVSHSVRPRYFRIIPAEQYLEEFASDRSHMQLPDGSYQATPPDYPCIVAKNGRTMTLPHFWNMGDTEFCVGHVMDQNRFVAMFANKADPVHDKQSSN